MTKIDELIAKTRELAAKATPSLYADGNETVGLCSAKNGISDAAFIAHACNSILALADEVERLRIENGHLADRWIAAKSHLKGPYHRRIDEPGVYLIYTRLYDSGDFVQLCERHTAVEEECYPTQQWRTVDAVCAENEALRTRNMHADSDLEERRYWETRYRETRNERDDLRAENEALWRVAQVARSGPCRHAADVINCPTCEALAALGPSRSKES